MTLKQIFRFASAATLALVSLTAQAQFSPGTVLTAAALNAALAAPNITGCSINGTPIGVVNPSTGVFTAVNSTGTISSAGGLESNGGPIPYVANTYLQSWTTGGAPALSFIASAGTANNHIGELIWTENQMQFRFANDAYNAAIPAFTISGGYGTGITGITSNSGTGQWTHTGYFYVGTAGVSQELGVAMHSTYARLREREAIDNFAITTNINTTGNQDNTADPSWELSMGQTVGGVADAFTIGRLAAGSTSPSALPNLLTLTSGGKLSVIGTITAAGGLQLPITTASTLPTCTTSNKGMLYAVSDATSPTYNGALTGGGAVSIPVYCNGSAWSAH